MIVKISLGGGDRQTDGDTAADKDLENTQFILTVRAGGDGNRTEQFIKEESIK